MPVNQANIRAELLEGIRAGYFINVDADSFDPADNEDAHDFICMVAVNNRVSAEYVYQVYDNLNLAVPIGA